MLTRQDEGSNSHKHHACLQGKMKDQIHIYTKTEIERGINLPLLSTVVPAIIFIFLSCIIENININIIAGTTVENNGKLILTEIFPSVQKHDI